MAQVIGLLGGIASGKSWVAKEFARRGAIILDADRIGHQVLTRPEVIAAAQARWGAGILAANGQIDRAQVAKIVFARTEEGKRELSFLEGITHPAISDELDRQLADLAKRDNGAIVILDAPVLLKAGWDKRCNHLVFVDASQEVRLQRAMTRGWTAEEFAQREAAQESLSEKSRKADTVFENGGDVAKTMQQIDQFWSKVSQNSG